MSKIFYDHLIMFEEIEEELGKYHLTAIQREELTVLADQHIHNVVIDLILTSLPEDKHETFLTHFHKSPGDEKLLTYLTTEIEDIEEKIRAEAKKVKKEILAEIKKAAR